jgi:hypothetical protein
MSVANKDVISLLRLQKYENGGCCERNRSIEVISSSPFGQSGDTLPTAIFDKHILELNEHLKRLESFN